MRELQEKWISDFTSLGKLVNVNGKQVRPETRTSIAIGKVSQLDNVGRNNVKAVIKVTGAKYAFSGFLNENSPVYALLQQAKEKDATIATRFEKKRKKDVDPTTPIEDLIVDSSTARDNIVNVVAGVYNYSTSEWILTDDSVSNPNEDPEYVKLELEKASYSTENFFGSNEKRISSTDADKKANHLISMYNFASEHNIERKIGLEDKAIKILSVYMLKACDQIQMKIHEIDNPNYSDYSHTKARSMLFSWMKVNPLSKEIMNTQGGFSTWITKFIDEGIELWNWAKNPED